MKDEENLLDPAVIAHVSHHEEAWGCGHAPGGHAHAVMAPLLAPHRTAEERRVASVYLTTS